MNPEVARLRHEDPDQFAREYAILQLAADRAFKLEICRDGPDDLPNRVIYIPEDQDGANLILPAQITEGPLATPPEILAMCCDIARAQFGPPFLIGFLSEAYMQIFPLEDRAEGLRQQRGDITKSFHRGDPRVTECLGVTLMHRRLNRALRSLAVHQPFHYEDGTVVFGEEQWIDSLEVETTSMGALVNAMVAAFGGEHN